MSKGNLHLLLSHKDRVLCQVTKDWAQADARVRDLEAAKKDTDELLRRVASDMATRDRTIRELLAALRLALPYVNADHFGTINAAIYRGEQSIK